MEIARFFQLEVKRGVTMLTIYTGRSRLMEGALASALRQASGLKLVVVPQQLTLQTERDLLAALELEGSFDLQVLSTERFCHRIFEAAGQPEGVRVDDRGRVMLVREAARSARDRLSVYRGCEHRRGFPERCAAQLERIRQAGVAPQALRECAQAQQGASARKLNDLAEIYEAYEALIAGRFQDGETEVLAAAERAERADFLREAEVWFYGYDMVPPTLHRLMAAVALVAREASVLLPLESDVRVRDFDVFQPMKRAKDRLIAAAQAQGVPLRQVPVYPERPDSEMEEALFVSETRRHADLRLLEEELFAVPPRPSDAPARAVQLAQLRNPLEECMYAAALTRRLAYKRGWHWGDILILTGDPDAYAAPLQTAFQTYGIPLFQASSRSAARHALAEYLLSALQCVEKHFPPEEMEALLGTGFLPISQEEAEEFSHYATRYALRGSRFLQPLRKGEPDEIARMEGVRQRAVAPLIALRDGLRCAETLKGQLTALFAFLTESGADQKNRERIDRLARAERWTEAGEEAQVWNRLLGAMDQMVALMGEARLSAREIREVLAEALSASVIKALPQSADAVFAQGVESACTRTVKAVLVLGLSDRPAGADEGLLTPPQKQALSEFTGAYLGPDDEDRCRIRHYQM
ncbi:MAG: hypothetical protein IJ234_11455, partial [Clostridia bacterium]|nr:hypothetical protein [Clostridia bacterium]